MRNTTDNYTSDNVTISFTRDTLSVTNMQDVYNYETILTVSKRGVKKALAELKVFIQNYGDITFDKATAIVYDKVQKVHRYCAMD
jgi:hypothetical protein